MSPSRRAFTLIELLVVIAIVAILAAILFPVFAQAKAAAKGTVDLSNQKQIGTAFMLYAGDSDDFYPLTSYPAAGNSWPMRCQPYIKNWEMFRSPGDLSMLWPPVGTPWPTPETPATDARWGYRWSSYLMSAFLAGSYNNGQFATTTTMASPANVIVLALADDKTGPRDHFHPFYWGSPAETVSGYMQNLTYDPATDRTKELKLEAFFGGANYAYADGHAKFGRWSQLWWRDLPDRVFAGNFDPRNEGHRP